MMFETLNLTENQEIPERKPGYNKGNGDMYIVIIVNPITHEEVAFKYPSKDPLNLQNIPHPIFPGLVQTPNDFVLIH